MAQRSGIWLTSGVVPDLFGAGLNAAARQNFKQGRRAVKRETAGMIDRAQQQNAVGRVLGDRDLHREIGIVICQRGLNRLGSCGTRKPGQHDVAGQRKRDAPIGADNQLGQHLRPAGKVHRDFVALAKLVLFVRGGLELSQHLERILLQDRFSASAAGWMDSWALIAASIWAFRPGPESARALWPSEPTSRPQKEAEARTPTDLVLHAFAFPLG